MSVSSREVVSISPKAFAELLRNMCLLILKAFFDHIGRGKLTTEANMPHTRPTPPTTAHKEGSHGTMARAGAAVRDEEYLQRHRLQLKSALTEQPGQ